LRVVPIVVLAIGAAIAGCGDDDDPGSISTLAVTISTPSAQIKKVDLLKAGATEANIDGDWLLSTKNAVWVTAGSEVIRIDPKTGQRNGGVRVPGGPCLGGTYAFGAMFMPTCYTDECLVRIDPETQRVTDQIRLPTPDLYNQESSMAAGEGAVWMIIIRSEEPGDDAQDLARPRRGVGRGRQRARLGERCTARPRAEGGPADGPGGGREQGGRAAQVSGG
jgi:hypothetical protein